jgi:hypothetical protein
MSTVEVLVRVHNVDPDEDIENIQQDISDALYSAGHNRIESVSVRFVEDEDNRHC